MKKVNEKKVEKELPVHGLPTLFAARWDKESCGYLLQCMCGFKTCAWERLAGAGDEMDDHFADVKVQHG